jgi:hypothetical protein
MKIIFSMAVANQMVCPHNNPDREGMRRRLERKKQLEIEKAAAAEVEENPRSTE